MPSRDSWSPSDEYVALGVPQIGARQMAACHGETQLNFGALNFKAEYKNASGTWVFSWGAAIGPVHQVRYSSSYGATQWRTRLDSGHLNSSMDVGVAVAGNEPLGFLAPGN